MATAIQGGLLEILRDKFPRCTPRIVGRMEEAIKIAYEDPAQDMTIMDLGLPDSRWQESARDQVQRFEARSPTVIVTGYTEEQVRPLLQEQGMQIVHKEPGMMKKLVSAMAKEIVRWKDAHRLSEISELDKYLKELVQNASPT